MLAIPFIDPIDERLRKEIHSAQPIKTPCVWFPIGYTSCHRAKDYQSDQCSVIVNTPSVFRIRIRMNKQIRSRTNFIEDSIAMYRDRMYPLFFLRNHR